MRASQSLVYYNEPKGLISMAICRGGKLMCIPVCTVQSCLWPNTVFAKMWHLWILMVLLTSFVNCIWAIMLLKRILWEDIWL